MRECSTRSCRSSSGPGYLHSGCRERAWPRQWPTRPPTNASPARPGTPRRHRRAPRAAGGPALPKGPTGRTRPSPDQTTERRQEKPRYAPAKTAAPRASPGAELCAPPTAWPESCPAQYAFESSRGKSCGHIRIRLFSLARTPRAQDLLRFVHIQKATITIRVVPRHGKRTVLRGENQTCGDVHRCGPSNMTSTEA